MRLKRGTGAVLKGNWCRFKGELVQFKKTKSSAQFQWGFVAVKKIKGFGSISMGVGAVSTGNRRSMSTPVNVSKSGPGFS